MLICPICNNPVEDNAAFCPNCGTQFAAPQQPAQPQYQQPQSQTNYSQPPYNQQPYGQPPMQFQPPVPPKKNNTGLIIAIVVIAVFVLAGIGFAAEKIFQSQGYGANTTLNDFYGDDNIEFDDEDDYDTKHTEYTKGTFDGTTYINEWANLKMDLPTNFSDGDDSMYSASTNEVTECGMYFISTTDPEFIYICFEDISAVDNISENKYLDAALSSLKDAGLDTVDTSDSYVKHIVAGQTFTRGKSTITENSIDFYMSVYVKIIDDHAVVITSASSSFERNDQLVSQITKAVN